MRYKQLAGTGTLVSEICLGTMTFSGRDFWTAIGTLDQSVADGIVGRALDAGVNFMDTADLYSEAPSEGITGHAIVNSGRKRTDIVLATKGLGVVGAGPNDGGASRSHILDVAKARLNRLGTDHIDLYQIRGFDPITPIGATVLALEDLVRQGHVRYVGVSNGPAWTMRNAGHRRPPWLDRAVDAAGLLLHDREPRPRAVDRALARSREARSAGLVYPGRRPAGGQVQLAMGTGPKARRVSFDFPPVDRDLAFGALM
jgi:aryl-alcohol dehydrogenase-like predicted oxidoreductase